MMRREMRLAAFAVGLAFAALPAAAAEFAAICVEGGGGMFEKKECSCLDDNLGSIRVLEKVGMRRLAAEGHTLKWELQKEPGT